MKEFKFYLITDTHYYAESLCQPCPEYDDFMHYEQKCAAETASINRSVFEFLKNADESDIILMAGDLTFNGEKKSHEEFRELLYELKAAGKKIFVITADHDYSNEPFAFGENGRYQPEGIKRENIPEMYKDFGFGQALELDKEHLSYVAQLSDDVRLLALNSDTKTDGKYTFEESQYDWIKKQAEKAKQDGQFLFAMNHYPVLAGQPILSLVAKTMVKDPYKFASFLADNGINMIFTGHMHNQSINEITTEKGNKFYDICTGAIIADPATIRLVTIKDESTVEIKSIPTPDFDFDTKGKDCKQYLSDLFDNMIGNVLYDFKYDTERAMGKLGIKKTPVMKFVCKTAGNIVNSLTLGGISRLLFFKCDKSIRKVKLSDFATELVRVVFEGNQPFKEGTPKGDAFLAFLSRVRFIFKKIDIKTPDGKKADLYEILKNTAGNYGIDDYNAVIKLK